MKVCTTPLFMKCNTFFHACLLLTKLIYRFTWRKNLMPWAFTIKWNKNNLNVLYNETMNRAPYSYASWRQRVDLVVNFGTKNATLSVVTNRLPNNRIKPFLFRIICPAFYAWRIFPQLDIMSIFCGLVALSQGGFFVSLTHQPWHRFWLTAFVTGILIVNGFNEKLFC